MKSFKDIIDKYTIHDLNVNTYKDALTQLITNNWDIVRYTHELPINEKYIIMLYDCIDNIYSKYPIKYKIGDNTYDVDDKTRFLIFLSPFSHPMLLSDERQNITFRRYVLNDHVRDELFQYNIIDGCHFYGYGNISRKD